MKIVAFVPIKLNSQRLPNKNILPLGDHSLSWYIFNTLKSSVHNIEIYVYCSDEKILEYIPSGVNFKVRDKYLDGDFVKGYEIYSSFIKDIDADIYVLAHTTSPFIKPTTIDDALDKVLNDGYDSAFSVEKHKTFAWYDNKTLNYSLESVPRTQDIKPVFIETSGFYIFERDVFVNLKRRIGNKPYMKELTSIEAIDIDEKEDYDFAKLLIERGGIR